MAVPGVARAAVVDVLLFTALRSLRNLLTRYGATTVPALDEIAAVRELMRAVDFRAEERLDTLPNRSLDNRWMRSGIPFAAVLDFSNVTAVPQNMMNLRPTEDWLRRRVVNLRLPECLPKAVYRVAVVGVQIEDSANVCGLLVVHLYEASTRPPHVPVSIGCMADEQTLFDTPFHAFPHIDALLFGVKRGHVRQNAALHSAGRRVLGGLGDIDDAETVLGLETLELDIVEEVSRRPVDLVEEDALNRFARFARIIQQRAKGLAFIGLARGFRYSVQLYDLATDSFRVRLQRVNLYVEREPFSFLLST